MLIFNNPGFAQGDDMYLSLRHCLEIGLENGPAIVNVRLDKEKANYQKQEAVSKLWPRIDGFGTYENYVKLPVVMIPGEIFGQPGASIPASLFTKHNLSGGFSASQLLYNQTVFVSLKLAEKAREISELSHEKVQNDLIYEISNLYFLIQATGDQLSIFQENVARFDRLLEITRAHHDAGLIRTVDFERVKVDRENLITQMASLEILYQQQIELMKYNTGLSESLKIIFTDSLNFSLLSTNSIPDSSINQRPEMRLLEKQKQLAGLNKKMAASEYYPTLSLYGQYYYQAQRDNFDFFKPGKDKWFEVGLVGLSLNIPIFNGFEKKSKINQAKIDDLQAKNNLEFTQRYFCIEYENAVEKNQNCKNAEARQRENTDLAENVYAKMLFQYEQGVASLSDLLGAENSLSESRLALFNAILQLRISELDILRATGELNSILKN